MTLHNRMFSKKYILHRMNQNLSLFSTQNEISSYYLSSINTFIKSFILYAILNVYFMAQILHRMCTNNVYVMYLKIFS